MTDRVREARVRASTLAYFKRHLMTSRNDLVLLPRYTPAKTSGADDKKSDLISVSSDIEQTSSVNVDGGPAGYTRQHGRLLSSPPSPYIGEEVIHDAHSLFPNQLVIGLRASIPSVMIDM